MLTKTQSFKEIDNLKRAGGVSWKAEFLKKCKSGIPANDATTFGQKVSTGQHLAVTEEEVKEWFRRLDPEGNGNSVHRQQLFAVVPVEVPDETYQKDLLSALYISEYDIVTGRINVPQFMQALLLGSEDEANKVVTRLKGLPIDGKWVFRDTLVHHLKTREEATENCKSLPITLLFFCVFFYLVTVHLRIDLSYELTNAVGEGLDSQYLEKKYPTSLWSLVARNAGAARMAHKNQVIGGIRMSKAPEDGQPLGRLCQYNTMDFLGELITTLGKNAQEPEPLKVCHDPLPMTSWIHWPLDFEDGMTHFSGGKGKTDMGRRMRAGGGGGGASQSVEAYEVDLSSLQKPAWVDEVTRLQYQVLTFNPVLNHYTSVKYRFITLPEGRIKVKQNIEAITSQPIWLKVSEDVKLNRMIVLVFDSLFFAIS
eukprot:gnl/MRDRNA2_/MRDRNA2_80364_c0_seq2.p1 gnl/MRDRNA2_/MRDRNA2_80364_c0~~gnl/MRDRNA2_/MRDRNA2_80364_c0_seq2.p1  ORF type:complete len:424 (+),score=70.85 gnl/MRDRNA2_/MRDRNA2_80364_c0_seq2:86-1357(+)